MKYDYSKLSETIRRFGVSDSRVTEGSEEAKKNGAARKGEGSIKSQATSDRGTEVWYLLI
jgi:hypothetical protein